MVSLKEAENIVKEARGVIYDSYEEFVDLYLFYDNEELGSFGGYNAPVVIEKSTGNIWGLNAFSVKFPNLLDEKKMVTSGIVA